MGDVLAGHREGRDGRQEVIRERCAVSHVIPPCISGHLTQSYRCARGGPPPGQWRPDASGSAAATVRKYPDCRIFPRREPHGGRTAGDDCGAQAGGTAAPGRARLGRGGRPRRAAAARPLAAGGAPRPCWPSCCSPWCSSPSPASSSGGQPQQAACRGCGAAARGRAALGGPAAGRVAGRARRGGTVPAVGQAYVAVGGGIAVVGDGLTLTGYALGDGSQLWQTTLNAPAGGVDHVGPRLAGRGHRRDPGGQTAGPAPRSVIDAATRHGAAALPGRGVRRRGRGVARDHRRRRPRRRDQLRQRERPRPLVPRDRPGPVLAGRRDDPLRGGVRRRLPGLVSGDRPAGHEPRVTAPNGRSSSPLGQPFSGTLAVAADGVGAVRLGRRRDRVQRVDRRHAVVDARRGARGHRPGAAAWST